ncbi:hypothetical protein RA280_19720 [Cupriavidus sp. CV2]|uniref:hypothetical protein n=1 Tax=Cupriavidus ulmosensis TaxID=3065913 RepID=UPI00296B47AC|nr:hypothetical protein [Cupriavidus sp. CV2]MDW3683932.1 hypothetical protein [Cupriavidus sp. CV2]
MTPHKQSTTAQRKGGALARLAGLWSRDPGFHRFVAAKTGLPCATKDVAAGFVRTVCGIETRVDLDHDGAAEAKFHICIRLPYMRWLQGARG